MLSTYCQLDRTYHHGRDSLRACLGEFIWISISELRRLLNCGLHHSIGYDQELNSKEEVDREPAFIALCFLTEDVMCPVTSHSPP